jgi:hypothetical protein
VFFRNKSETPDFPNNLCPMDIGVGAVAARHFIWLTKVVAIHASF